MTASSAAERHRKGVLASEPARRLPRLMSRIFASGRRSVTRNTSGKCSALSLRGGRQMMGRFRPGIKTRACLASAAVLAFAWSAAPAQAATGPVSSTPAAGTPQLANTGATEQVRQLAQCGGTMYAVGTFSSIQRYSTTYARNNAFSFSATSPFKVTTWNPNVNGIVNSIAFSPDCSMAYLGGTFSSVNGTAVK